MAIVRPFRALRPDAGKVSAVASVPYDVVNTAEARALAAGNPYSLLHITRPDIDLPDDTPPDADLQYQTARTNLERLIHEAPLTTDPQASFFVYRLVMQGRAQTGIVGVCAVDDYDRDVIRKHEKTRPDKEDDRTRHLLALGVQVEPVFLAYRDAPALDELVARASADVPLYDFMAPDGIQHTIWRMTDTAAVSAAFADIPALYVADGHHRSASASRARAALRNQDANPTDDAPYNFFLAVLFPASQLQILPYHRVVTDLAHHTPDAFLATLRATFASCPATPNPTTQGKFSVYCAGAWHSFHFHPVDGADPLAGLDVSRLQYQVLQPLLGIADPRTDKRLDFVGGIRGTAELERRVNEGRAAAAFSLYPTGLDDLFAVSDQGLVMPPKSTWFEPKLRSGLLMYALQA
ncbi:MAG: DUF1015 family protein [Chloracidobacterium sp.]|uniref:DUF1015 domain-containing protein n=1 Tax=Chloracidobacterium validum TaxID=2821543 RepID=A0ABX8B8E6_9BACT|nr:DUF1015 family protein [Chloracidobacterium validum]QUW03222.1 DUF1015 domain-containing protein [Chloracidobacterium validum]